MKRGIGLRFALAGILHAVRTERNMRIHLAAAAVAVALGAIGRLDRDGWLWIGLAIAFVWSAECVNTAIERLVDLAAGERKHPLAKAAKDAAAAAVLIAAAFSVVVACAVLLPALAERWMNR